jgi:hypothetical protein
MAFGITYPANSRIERQSPEKLRNGIITWRWRGLFSVRKVQILRPLKRPGLAVTLGSPGLRWRTERGLATGTIALTRAALGLGLTDAPMLPAQSGPHPRRQWPAIRSSVSQGRRQ